MTTQSRATSAELAAEFERAIGSLDSIPVPVEAETTDHWFRLIRRSLVLIGTREEGDDTELLIRIAAIALEGAARLRRGT